MFLVSARRDLFERNGEEGGVIRTETSILFERRGFKKEGSAEAVSELPSILNTLPDTPIPFEHHRHITVAA